MKPNVDPGKHRIFRWTQGARPNRWLASHTPSNTCKFTKITLPKCAPSKGTAEIICPTCKGTRRQQVADARMSDLRRASDASAALPVLHPEPGDRRRLQRGLEFRQPVAQRPCPGRCLNRASSRRSASDKVTVRPR